MVQQLLPLMPNDIGQAALVAALCGTLLGAALWLVGARFSRPMITLVAVAVGAVLGRNLPAWTNWNVNTMAASVGGAVVLGMSGYVLHRVWVGLGLALVLGCWAALATWTFGGGAGTTITWPPVDATTTTASFSQALWLNLPEGVRKLLPYACGGASISGFFIPLLWPRLGAVLLYSALGTSLVVGLGLLAIENRKPDWITIVPAQTWAQVSTLLALVAFGAIVQWQLAPTAKPAKPAPAAPKPAEKGAFHP